MLRKLAGVGLAALGAATLIGVSPAAAATGQNGVCESGEFCFWFNSGRTGSMGDIARTAVSDLGNNGSGVCYKFKSAGNGQGLCIKNNAASVFNKTGQTVSVFFNSGYLGNSDTFNAGTGGDLNAYVKNDNASYRTSFAQGNDYPYRNSTGMSAQEQWSFPAGQCTSFAAWAVVSRTGRINFHQSYGGAYFGNAQDWDNAARTAGIPVGTTPRVGAIAVSEAGSAGHVAYVTKVNADGSFEVDEYNWAGYEIFSHRTAHRGSSSGQFGSFIYF